MSFEIVRSRDKVKLAAEMWKRQYCPDGKWKTFEKHWPRQPEEMYSLALAAKYSVRKMIAALNPSWVRIFCGECKQYVDTAVEIQRDYESGATVCVACLKEIVKEVGSR